MNFKPTNVITPSLTFLVFRRGTTTPKAWREACDVAIGTVGEDALILKGALPDESRYLKVQDIPEYMAKRNRERAEGVPVEVRPDNEQTRREDRAAQEQEAEEAAL